MFVDRADVLLKELRHQFLSEPDRLGLETTLDTRAAVFRLINEELAGRRGRGGGIVTHGQASRMRPENGATQRRRREKRSELAGEGLVEEGGLELVERGELARVERFEAAGLVRNTDKFLYNRVLMLKRRNWKNCSFNKVAADVFNHGAAGQLSELILNEARREQVVKIVRIDGVFEAKHEPSVMNVTACLHDIRTAERHGIGKDEVSLFYVTGLFGSFGGYFLRRRVDVFSTLLGVADFDPVYAVGRCCEILLYRSR